MTRGRIKARLFWEEIWQNIRKVSKTSIASAIKILLTFTYLFMRNNHKNVRGRYIIFDKIVYKS